MFHPTGNQLPGLQTFLGKYVKNTLLDDNVFTETIKEIALVQMMIRDYKPLIK